MKVKIILAIFLMSLSVCQRQERSTVLTDESKRILEQFDFSNFDKQEALNYIDRQRYENQIRGKRNQCKAKRNHNEQISDLGFIKNTEKKAVNCDFENTYRRKMINKLNLQEPTTCDFSYGELLKLSNAGNRIKRGHYSKKKHKLKSYGNEYGKEAKRRRRKKKKKKKKKKRHYWGVWTEWSPCSVTCGRGRKIRWRKCIAKNCTTGELEMGEKTCQLPACNLLTKLLGF